MFGNKAEKAAQDAAAKAEAERLTALPTPDLGAEIMAAYGPGGPSRGGEGRGLNFLQIGNFMMASFPRGTKQLTAIQNPLLAGVQALKNAGLLVQGTGVGGPAAYLK
ncbi:MAG: hypothetical protein WBV53_08740, partial [Solirubrobacterales bacterium]